MDSAHKTARPSEYPQREAYFAHRYCRLLTKTCAAQEIGPDGCWMLCVIAMLEDSKRYSDAVTFYNGQLMAVAGFTREHTLITVRNRAIKGGWLHYEAGAKRVPGRYWVTIPARFASIPDGPCDETIAELTDENVSDANSFPDENVSESVGKASVKAEGKRQPFLPIPKPSPSSAKAGPTPAELLGWWNTQADQSGGKLSRAMKLTDTRARACRCRLKDPDFPRVFRDALQLLPHDKAGLDWQPNFDWMIANDANALKVAEGQFRANRNGQPTPEVPDPLPDFDEVSR